MGNAMPTRQSQQCLAHLSRSTFRRYERLSQRANDLWKIERGAVRSYSWNAAGHAITLGYWGPGDVVGGCLSRFAPYKTECLTRVEAIRIPKRYWPALAEAILAHAQQTQELLQIVRSPSAYGNLRQLLDWLAGKFGRPVPAGQLIDLPLTHREIAESIGTARVTATRLLNQLEVEGAIVRQRQHRVIVCHPARSLGVPDGSEEIASSIGAAEHQQIDQKRRPDGRGDRAAGEFGPRKQDPAEQIGYDHQHAAHQSRRGDQAFVRSAH